MIYLDNSATSFPKPKSVIKEVGRCIREYCANSGRSAHRLALYTAERIFETRENISSMLGCPDRCENVVFTQNATYALNIAIKGAIKPHTHVLVSDIEHNSVIRPLESLKKAIGIQYDLFDSSDIENSIKEKIKPTTKYLISTLTSNVTGAEIPLKTLSGISKELGLFLIVDASQYIGHKGININETPCDILCAPGHKALFGIQGCGFAFFNTNESFEPLITGGSGNNSLNKDMPPELPEHFEAGTLPTPSIVALNEGIKFINKVGIEEISKKIDFLTKETEYRLSKIDKVTLYGAQNGIIAFNIKGLNSHFVAERLSEANICTRAGLHCAPSVHKLLNTLDMGAVRLSFSYFNRIADIDRAYKEIKSVSERYS